MNILAQYNPDSFKNLKDIDDIAKILAPVTFDPTVMNYASLVEQIDIQVREHALSLLREVIEQADLAFRNADGRTQRYYVKNTRKRMILTIFGELVYKRTEYQDRSDKSTFIYIDRKLGIGRRMRYDPTLCSLICQLYSDQNSMIKVGRLVGDRIHAFSPRSDTESHAIPRQTVQQILLRLGRIKPKYEKRKETPSTLFIMADEKFIPLQGEGASESLSQDDLVDGEVSSFKGHKKAMTKMAVSFEGRVQEARKDGTPTERWRLTNKHVFTFPDDTRNFWQDVYDELCQIYDIEKIHYIYVMGDGATWIKAGVSEMKSQYCTSKYAADRFHVEKAIAKLSPDEGVRRMLSNYAAKGMRKEFEELAESARGDAKVSKKAFDDALKYVLNQMAGLKVMNEEARTGCSMEQAVQHVLASVFTSVPKAYDRDNLHVYVSARTSQQNGVDMRLSWLEAYDKFLGNGEKDVDLSKDGLDLSLFDSKKTDPYFHNTLNDNPNARRNWH